ncbi:hypothetical protein NQ314_010475 [Rhamnusium bicolor]|uniref:PiggyBac transposable element-derived protein domain-containing protein n=1 Tax=Rhamnusium bicolor TaxID=1586634 RepID=A0AAV8XQ10_9CUCU|nr:hypothetical protein NQ314_010475 [Rhamnusium bicolor]
MDESTEEQLLHWFEETEPEDQCLNSDEDSSTHDPYSTDDSLADPEYVQSESGHDDSEYEFSQDIDKHKLIILGPQSNDSDTDVEVVDDEIKKDVGEETYSDKDKEDPLFRVSWLLESVILSSQDMFSPQEALSLDESLGRLKFRVYIKNKKSKYGIQFYDLCSSDGFVLNMEIYKGTNNIDDARKVQSLQLSECLQERKTHTTGTLRSNRKRNPKEITEAKLRAGEPVWRRCGNIYVSKWRDKRDVLAITTGFQPKLI